MYVLGGQGRQVVPEKAVCGVSANFGGVRTSLGGGKKNQVCGRVGSCGKWLPRVVSFDYKPWKNLIKCDPEGM